MTTICACSSGSSNLGTAACIQVAGEARQEIFAPYLNSTGAVSNISASATIDGAFWNTHFQRYDNTGTLVADANRWFITPRLVNTENVQADDVFEDFTDGTRSKVRNGVRLITRYIDGGTPELLKKLLTLACADVGVMFIDTSKSLIGNGGTAGELRFMRIVEGSFTARLVTATGGNTKQKIMYSYQIDPIEFDSDLKMIYAEDMTVNPTDIKPLIDLTATLVGSVSATAITINLKTTDGSIVNPIGPSGLVAGDFVLEELSPAAGVIAIASLTQSTPASGGGINYTFTFAAQTTADILALTLKKVGYDAQQLETLTFTIPA